MPKQPLCQRDIAGTLCGAEAAWRDLSGCWLCQDHTQGLPRELSLPADFAAQVEGLEQKYLACEGKKASEIENLKREGRILKEIVPRTRQNGCLAWDDFMEICRWKSSRRLVVCENENDPGLVQQASQIALSTPHERLRIGAILSPSLAGVGWPRASALLHLLHEKPYPILDQRAVRTVGYHSNFSYTFDFWLRYTTFCQARATALQVSLRTLDRALLQYDIEQGYAVRE